jgi:predicted RNA binding protein with dsRBD fold (UPF0201 family)
MKGKLALLIGLFVVLNMLLVPFMVPTNAAPRQQPEVPAGEPNNTFGTASSITTGTAIQETIAPSGDVDWYALTVDQQGELQVSITNVATDLAINVRVWNANKDAVSAWFAPLAAGGDTLAVVDVAEAGRYFLEVADGANNADSVQAYELLATFTATADSDELNNSFGSAAPLTFDIPYQANILPSGDVDWYSLEVGGHGELSVQITDVASDLAVSLRLWNANKDTLSSWIAPLANGGNTSAILDLPDGGTYYLEVAGNSAQRSTQPYIIELDFVPAADAFEPNNTFGMAAPLLFGESSLANILPQFDIDWYSIEVDHHGELNIAITDMPTTLAISVRVWNDNKDTLTGWLSPLAAGGDNIASVDLPEPGTYYLEVAEAGSERSVEPYSITVFFTRAVDPFEKNETFGTASRLSLDQAVQTNILPQGETDWHVFDVAHQGELRIVASDVPANLDIDLRIWNNNKDTLTGWIAPLTRGGDTTAQVDLPSAGSYYLEVADGGYDARSIEPFTLQGSFIPAADQGEPNDTLVDATPVELDTTIPANILPVNDTDWCRLEIGTTGELRVLITNVAPELEIAIRLWNEQEEVISDWVYPLAAGGNTSAVFSITEPGVYYLEVVDNRSNRSIQPYLLRFSMEEIDPATMTFTQIITDTETEIDTEKTVEAGTETITTTTTTVIITTTIRSSGETSETEVVTSTQTLTDTSVVTVTGTPATSATPLAPPSGAATTPVAPSSPLTSTPALTPTEEITPTSDITPATEITSTEEITSSPDITTTSAPTSTSAQPAAPAVAISPPPAMPSTAVIPEGATIAVEGIILVLPAGWQAAEEGGPFRGLALNPEDLAADIPKGPRLWVLAPGVADLEFTEMLEQAGETAQLFEAATMIQVGTQTGVAVGIQETFGDQTINRRYLFINPGAGEAYQFILEAPAAQWDEQVPLLEGTLASVQIEPN